jgi:hypothetical protein
MSGDRAILPLTMKGPDLLLAHLAILSDEHPAEPDERPSARERLDAELGPELAGALLAALAPPPQA